MLQCLPAHDVYSEVWYVAVRAHQDISNSCKCQRQGQQCMLLCFFTDSACRKHAMQLLLLKQGVPVRSNVDGSDLAWRREQKGVGCCMQWRPVCNMTWLDSEYLAFQK